MIMKAILLWLTLNVESTVAEFSLENLINVREVSYFAKCVVQIWQRTISSEQTLVVSLGVQNTTNISSNYMGSKHEDTVKSTPERDLLTGSVHSLLYEDHFQILLMSAKSVEFDSYNFIHNIGGYLIILEHGYLNDQLNVLKVQLVRIASYLYWNPKAPFAVLVKIINSKNELNLAEKFLEILWLWRLINITVLIFNSELESLNAYTWFPFSDRKCGKEVTDTVLQYQWRKGRIDDLFLNTIFPPKFSGNLNGCQLIVSTFSWPPYVFNTSLSSTELKYDGVEIRLLQDISRMMNFTVKFWPPPPGNVLWGSILSNGTWTGLVGDLVYRRSDIAFACFRTKPERYKKLDATFSYSRERYVWFVPRPEEKLSWESMFHIFPMTVWILILPSFVLSVFALYLLANRPKGANAENFHFKNIVSLILNAWGVMLNAAIHVTPETNPVRMFFLVWIAYCFLLINAFQTFLVSVLTSPAFENGINNVEELLNSGMEFGFMSHFKPVFNNVSDWTHLKILKEYVPCDDISSCLDRMAYAKDFAVFTSEKNGMFRATSKYVDKKGKALFKPMNQYFFAYNVAMYVEKGSPFLEHMNKVIIRDFEGGFLSQSWKHLKHFTKLQAVFSLEKSDDNTLHVLSMDHVIGIFYLHLIGNIIAFLIFLLESTFYYCNKSLLKKYL